VTVGNIQVLTGVQIVFEAAGGETQHAPLVHGQVGGLETRLVLDTGSDVHLLTKEVLDSLGLPFEEGEEGIDHSGATMPSWSVEDVEIRLGELDLTLRDVVAIPSPKPFSVWGIGGVLSPQHLHPTAWTVLDFAALELLLVEGGEGSVAEWLARRSPAAATLRLEREPGFATVVVRAAVAPYPERATLLNSGGRHTEFAAAALPGVARGEAERIGGGVSDADVLGARIGAARLLVAGHEVGVADLVVRDSMHGPQGMMGMDVLRGTSLAVCADPGLPVLWQVPAGGVARTMFGVRE